MKSTKGTEWVTVLILALAENLLAAEPTWSAVKQALAQLGVWSYTQLEDRLTLGDYKKNRDASQRRG